MCVYLVGMSDGCIQSTVCWSLNFFISLWWARAHSSASGYRLAAAVVSGGGVLSVIVWGGGAEYLFGNSDTMMVVGSRDGWCCDKSDCRAVSVFLS